MTEIVLKPTIKLRALFENGNAVILAEIETPYGPFTLRGEYPLWQVARKLDGVLRRLAEQKGVPLPASVASGLDLEDMSAAGDEGGVETGGILSRLKRLGRKVAMAAAIGPVLKSVQAIQKNPVLARAVGLTTAVIPGIATAQKAAQQASNLVQSAMNGDLVSKKALARLKSMALMGLPQAKEALGTVTRVAKVLAARGPVDFLKGAPKMLVQEAARNVASATGPAQAAQEAVNSVLARLPAPLQPFAQAALHTLPGAAQLQQVAQLGNFAESIADGRPAFPPGFPGLLAAASGLDVDVAGLAAAHSSHPPVEPTTAPFAEGAWYARPKCG